MFDRDMVKAMGEPCLTLSPGLSVDPKSNSIFYCDPKYNAAKPGVAIDITPKKFRPSLRNLFFSSSKKTKQRKDAREDERPYLTDEVARQRFTDVNLESVVELPPHMDLHEWLATHTIKFFEHINFLYGAISDYCTCPGCASMTAPNNVQYQWVDEKGRKCKVTASQYIEYVTTYIDKTICDENVFPTKYGNVFPATFETTVKKMLRLLYHVLAHIYHAHFNHVLLFNLQGFINTVTAHFLIFCKRFNLLEARDMEPLDDLYQKLMSVNVRIIGKDDSKTSLSSSSGSGLSGGSDNNTNRKLAAGSEDASRKSPTGSLAEADTEIRTSQTSLSGVHIKQTMAAGGVGELSPPGGVAARGVPTQRTHKESTGSNGSIHNYLPFGAGGSVIASGKASLSQLVNAMEENKENLLQLSLSSSPVLTTQPNGHPRTPST